MSQTQFSDSKPPPSLLHLGGGTGGTQHLIASNGSILSGAKGMMTALPEMVAIGSGPGFKPTKTSVNKSYHAVKSCEGGEREDTSSNMVFAELRESHEYWLK